MTNTAPVAVGRSLAGYTLMRVLGEGSHGTVYLAATADPPRRVALKVVVLPQGAARAAAQTAFLDAAAAQRDLGHRDAVAVLGAGVEGVHGWLAMEAIPGCDLGRYTQAPRLLPPALVLQVCERLARVLAHAHRRGLVHRDVKPANVLVHWPSNTVKLGDFGLSRLADAAATATGLMLGSPHYMAPEMLAGGVPTPGTDLYALGVALYELLVGSLPFAGDTMGALMHNISHAPAPPLHMPGLETADELNTLVQSLLEKSPRTRPTDAAVTADALARIAATWPAGAPR